MTCNEAHLIAMVEEDSFHDVTKVGVVCRRTCGHSLSADDDAELGTPSTAAEGNSIEVEEELNSIELERLQSHE